MKRLFILRHAKSSWAEPGITDHARPLNARGQAALAPIAGMLVARGYAPERVICSTSQRTRQTLDGIREAIQGASISYEDALYGAPDNVYLQYIRNAGTAASLMLVGHNPACDELTQWLCGRNGPAMEKYMQNHFATGALAVIDFDLSDWAGVDEGSGALVDFVLPRELAD